MIGAYGSGVSAEIESRLTVVLNMVEESVEEA